MILVAPLRHQSPPMSRSRLILRLTISCLCGTPNCMHSDNVNDLLAYITENCCQGAAEKCASESVVKQHRRGSVFLQRFSRPSFAARCPSDRQRAQEGRVPAAPAAPMREKCTGQEPQVMAASRRPSLCSGFTAYTRSPRRDGGHGAARLCPPYDYISSI